MRGISGLVTAMEDVVSRLKGAINDRGRAIAALKSSMVAAMVPKVRSEIRECQDMIALANCHPRFCGRQVDSLPKLCSRVIRAHYSSCTGTIMGIDGERLVFAFHCRLGTA